MTTVAPIALAAEAEPVDESVLALDAPETLARTVPLARIAPPKGLAPRAFHAFVEEVAVHADLALAMIGLDEQYEVSADGADFESGSVSDVQRAILFQDEDGDQLPVYVSCGSDGLAFVCVAREDGAILVVTDGHALGEVEDLVREVAAAIEREVPKPTIQ